MELTTLLEALRDPSVYPHAAPGITVVHTHASAVVLAGEHVYKLKKPVDFGFLDYSTLERRRQMCAAEVELNRREVALNRRLAPGVYLGVIPITLDGQRVALGGAGEVVEYAVHMRRLPDTATLSHRILAGPLGRGTVERVGRMIANFHRDARRGPDVSRWATFDRVRENCRENFAGLAVHADVVAPRAEFMRLELVTEAELTARYELIERRAALNVPCETHGDLRLEHVYLRPEGEPCIVDCIEFSERFRCADPVADVAFLAMDLQAHGDWTAAGTLLDAYFDESGDGDGRALVPLYLAYRSVVRAKVRAIQAASPGIPVEQRRRALQLARAHIQLAVVDLAPAAERPCLVLVGGLPGTGKSVLSEALATTAHFHWLRADAIRKELAGLDPLASGSSAVPCLRRRRSRLGCPSTHPRMRVARRSRADEARAARQGPVRRGLDDLRARARDLGTVRAAHGGTARHDRHVRRAGGHARQRVASAGSVRARGRSRRGLNPRHRIPHASNALRAVATLPTGVSFGIR
jgi:aminoglycoside phosphotransferase family enzyme